MSDRNLPLALAATSRKPSCRMPQFQGLCLLLTLLLAPPSAALDRAGSLAACTVASEPPNTQPPLGIDVSHFSGAIDWAAVQAAGYSFVYVKATEGIDSKDPRFAENWEALHENGLARGAYHFYVTEDDPIQQAEFFLQTVRLLPGDLLPVVDIEVIGHGTQPGLAKRLRSWLDTVEARLGIKPMIYTSPKFWKAHLTSTFGEYRLWVAEYEVDAPLIPAGWSAWDLWQFQGDADISGVEKGADRSRAADGLRLLDLRIPTE